MCKDCSKPSKSCEFHAQSPIPLESTTATANRLCRDRHLMRFKTGNCKLEDVRLYVYTESEVGLQCSVMCNNSHFLSFLLAYSRILPHVLRAYQPACSVEPKLDFSFGFPDPWILQYTDIMIPSQHTLGGKRFSAEIVLTHTYSNKTMLDKLVGNLAIMVEVGTQQDHYPFFEVYLQRWERAASRIASTCSSNSTSNQASNITQTSNVTQPVVVARRLGTNLRSSAARHAQSNHAAEPLHRRLSNVSSQVPSNVSTSPPEEEESSRPQYIQEEYYQGFYHPYMFYKDTGTEYYFRYQGSVIEPPCIQNVHWRVMRLPITISPAQFRRLDQIFTTRLNPTTCEPETAGRPRITVRPNEGVSNSSIPTIKRDVTRPLQTITFDHKLVYCECANWPSIAPKDAMYCNQTMEERGVSNLTIVE